MARRLIGIALLAVLLVGCSSQLRTALAEPDNCDLALLAGSLERHPQTGLGIATSGDEITPVQWPFGYQARMDIADVVLVDPTGEVVAREHDRVEVSGSSSADGIWIACGRVNTVSNEGG